MATAALCDPTTISNAAKCLKCLNPDEHDAITLQLMCNWATNRSTPTGNFRITEAGDIRITEAGDRRIIE